MELIPFTFGSLLLMVTCATAALWLVGGDIDRQWIQTLAAGWGFIAPFIFVAALILWEESRK